MSEGKKSKYTRRIWIRALKINLVLKDFPDTIQDIETRLSKMATLSKKDLHDISLELVIRGLEQAEKEYLEMEELFGNSAELDSEHKQLIALFEAQEEIAKRNKMLDDLTPLFKHMGVEAFEQWCNDNGYDAQEFYRLHRESLEKLTWAKRAKEWISFELGKHDQPVPIDIIKKSAKADGILEQDESNWQAFEKHAQRMGVTGKPYGYWFNDKPTNNRWKPTY